MRHILPLLLFFLTSLSVLAQNNFKPGTIVTASGDSIKGSIDDQLWRRNPSVINFKDASGSERSYSPDDLKAFVIDGKVIYESHQVSYDASSEELRSLSWSVAPTLKQAGLFLKVVLKGKATLYRFVEDNDRVHYFIGKDGKVEELLNHQYIVNNQRRVNRQYLQQLDAAFKDCAAIKITANTTYQESTLVKLFEKYATCTGSTVTKAKKEKTIVKFGIVAAVAQDQFGGDPNFKPGFGYGGGAFVNFFLPGRFYKWSVYTELTYRKFGEQDAAHMPAHLGRPIGYDVSSLKFTGMARDHFYIGKVRSFLSVGASYSGGMSDTYETQSVKDKEFNARFISGVGGLGVVLNHAGSGPKFIVDARFEYGNGLDEFPMITKHISVGLNLGVQF